MREQLLAAEEERVRNRQQLDQLRIQCKANEEPSVALMQTNFSAPLRLSSRAPRRKPPPTTGYFGSTLPESGRRERRASTFERGAPRPQSTAGGQHATRMQQLHGSAAGHNVPRGERARSARLWARFVQSLRAGPTTLSHAMRKDSAVHSAILLALWLFPPVSGSFEGVRRRP